MTVIFHPEFPNDIRKFESGYEQISLGLAARFRNEVLAAVDAGKAAPTVAGHFRTLAPPLFRNSAAAISKLSRSLSSMASLMKG